MPAEFAALIASLRAEIAALRAEVAEFLGICQATWSCAAISRRFAERTRSIRPFATRISRVHGGLASKSTRRPGPNRCAELLLDANAAVNNAHEVDQMALPPEIFAAFFEGYREAVRVSRRCARGRVYGSPFRPAKTRPTASDVFGP